MYFEDMTPYNYTTVRLPADAPALVNFGWLDALHDYSCGPVPPEFVTCLLGMAASYTNGMRGFHLCPFCGNRDQVVMTLAGEPVYLGNAEVRIRAGDTTYVAPSLLPHYVEAHGYRPPDEVLEVLAELCADDDGATGGGT